MPLPKDLQELYDKAAPLADFDPSPAPESDAAGTVSADPSPEPASAPAEPTPSSPTDVETRLAAEAERTARLEREMEFLRRQAAVVPAPPVAPAPDPVQLAMDALRVSEDDWTEALTDPRKGANIVTNALQQILLLSNRTTRAQVLAEMSKVLDERDAALQSREDGNHLITEFWAKHEDLKPYDKVVKQVAFDVAQEADERIRRGAPWNNEDVIREVGQRTRATLQSYGITPQATAAPDRRTATVTRIRPATADMGSGVSRGSEPVPPFLKQIYKLAGRRA